jgi:hypothetical protein
MEPNGDIYPCVLHIGRYSSKKAVTDGWKMRGVMGYNITSLFMPISFLVGFFGMNFFQPSAPLCIWDNINHVDLGSYWYVHLGTA